MASLAYAQELTEYLDVRAFKNADRPILCGCI